MLGYRESLAMPEVKARGAHEHWAAPVSVRRLVANNHGCAGRRDALADGSPSAPDQRSLINEAELKLRDEGDGGELSPMPFAIPATRSGAEQIQWHKISERKHHAAKDPPKMRPEAVGSSASRQLMQGNFQEHVVL
jgi:hypothetical protein